MIRKVSLALPAFLGLALALPAQERDEAWLRQRVRAVKDSDTNAWRKIPWAPSLVAARRASERENRPVFLFCHDGNIDSGRC
jgi:hypothetical protein